MSFRTIAAVLLIAVGTAVLVYPRFSVPTERKSAQVGPLEFSIQKRQRVEVPSWAGIAAIAVGAGLLLVRRR